MCGPIVYPPVITWTEPIEDCILDTWGSFFARVFSIAIDSASRVIAYVNDVIAYQNDTPQTSVSWTFSGTTNINFGVNTIRIVVENDYGSSEKVVSEVITEEPVTSPPQITSHTPISASITDVKGGTNTRTFQVSVDQPATIIFSVDGLEKRRIRAVENATWVCDFSGYSEGTHGVVVEAVNTVGNDSLSWSWEIIELEVTLVSPSTSEVSDLIGAEREFIASCDHPAIMRICLDGNTVCESSSNVQEISYTFPSAPEGEHSVQVFAEFLNGVGSASWDWDVDEAGGCGSQDDYDSDPYLTSFGWIKYYRCGSPDCGGGSGSWKDDGVCVHNALMRYARTGKITDYEDKLKSCYWMQNLGCPEHCYAAKNEGKDVCIAAVLNSTAPDFDDHAICAENLGGDIEDWNNWRFFQYSDSNIQKGDIHQMPVGTSTENTRVKIREVKGIRSCDEYVPSEFPVVVFLIDQNGDVTVE